MTETVATETWAASVVEVIITKLTGLPDKLKQADLIFKLSTPKGKFLSQAVPVETTGDVDARFRILAQAKVVGKHCIAIETSHKAKVGKFDLPSDIFTSIGSSERTVSLSTTLSITFIFRTARTQLPLSLLNPEPKNVIIHVDSNHVIPGETFNGYVCYSAPEPADFGKGVLLQFVSSTVARWKDDKSKYGNTYSSESIHMKENLILPMDSTGNTDDNAMAASGVFVWSFEVTLPPDVPATWRYGKSHCSCFINAAIDFEDSARKRIEITKQLHVAAVPMPADPFNLKDFVRDYGNTEKIKITTTVDPVVQIGSHLIAKIEVQNHSTHSVKALKVRLIRQNIFAGNLERVDAGRRGLKYFTPEQTLKLGDKIQGESWPLAPGVTSTLQVTFPLDPKLSPSVSRARSWNAYRQYCLVITATTTDLINRKTARSATPIMLIHELNAKLPIVDPALPTGTLCVSLVGANPVQKAHRGSRLTLGMTPRGSERSSSTTSTDERYNVSETPNTSFWDAFKSSLDASEKQRVEATRASAKRSSSKRDSPSSRRSSTSSSSSSSSDRSTGNITSPPKKSSPKASRTSEDIGSSHTINLAEIKRQRRRSVDATMETPKAAPPSFVATRNRRNSVAYDTPRERSSQTSTAGSERPLGSPGERGRKQSKEIDVIVVSK